MADQKQVTRIWWCPAGPGNPNGLRFGRNRKPPHHCIYDGDEKHVKEAVKKFTDKKTMITDKRWVEDKKTKELISAPHYFQDIYPDDWSKIFLDLDDGDFATLEEAQA